MTCYPVYISALNRYEHFRKLRWSRWRGSLFWQGLPHVLRCFRWYDKLCEFADWAGVKVVNVSSFSWIDAFERPEPTSL